jgi:hypothetical protein
MIKRLSTASRRRQRWVQKQGEFSPTPCGKNKTPPAFAGGANNGDSAQAAKVPNPKALSPIGNNDGKPSSQKLVTMQRSETNCLARRNKACVDDAKIKSIYLQRFTERPHSSAG